MAIQLMVIERFLVNIIIIIIIIIINEFV